jgi:hypothetical protein
MNHPNYHVLFTKDLAFEQLKYLLWFEKVFETYYNSGIYGVTLKYVLSVVNKKYEFFQAFTEYLGNNDFFIRNFDLREKFRLLYEFLTTVETVEAVGGKFDEKIIKDLLIHDYVSNTKKTAMPEFLRKEITLETKELVNANKETITKYFNGVEVKKLFYIPVDTKVVKHGETGICSILIENGVLIYNPLTGEYCYL